MNRFKRSAGPAFLVAALLLFGAFHFLPAFGTPHGWELWIQFWDLAVNQRTLLKGGMSPMIATFGTFSAGIVASPCAIPLIRKSLLARWFIAFNSALVCLGLFFFLLVIGASRLGSGGLCLIFSAGCNFIGIILTRYEGRHREMLKKLSGI